MHRLFSRHGCVALAFVALALLGFCSFSLPARAEATSKSPGGSANPIDINKASAEQLTSIPGIGKVMAQRIIEFREQHGPFDRVEDLMKIKGIGEKSFLKIRPYVKVGKKS